MWPCGLQIISDPRNFVPKTPRQTHGLYAVRSSGLWPDAFSIDTRRCLYVIFIALISDFDGPSRAPIGRRWTGVLTACCPPVVGRLLAWLFTARPGRERRSRRPEYANRRWQRVCRQNVRILKFRSVVIPQFQGFALADSRMSCRVWTTATHYANTCNEFRTA